MTESTEVKERRSGMANLSSLLLQAYSNQRDWRNLARALADELRGPGLDWRDLARALEQVRTESPTFMVGSDSAAGLLDRVVILAMRIMEAGSAADLQASAEILEACAPGVEPEQMLRKVRVILRRQIPFDVFSYTEYYHGSSAADGALVHSRFARDGEEEFRWPERWVKLPAAIVNWVEGNRRWISDVAAFYAEHKEAETLKANLVAREYERRGITSFLVARRMDGDRVSASLTLGRRLNGEHRPFNQIDQNRLDELRLEPMLRRVGEAFKHREAALAQEIAELFTPSAEPAELAHKAVHKLGDGFGWEYVGLFRVNRTHGRFEVVAEYDPSGRLKLPANYTQGLQEGMLSHVLREGRELYVPNVQIKPPQFDYISTSSVQASAMCFPIRLNQGPDPKIEWILDLESSQFNAFPQPEQEALRTIVHGVERSLPLWFEARLCATLLNLVEQGVVLLGERTLIERANAAARRLLGLPQDLQLPSEGPFSDLEEFAADRATRELIVGGCASSAGAHLQLKGPDGIERRALAGGSYRDEAFHRRVWLLSDVAQAEWVGALRYMETAVRTVAAQAHGRLLLAGALLRRAQAGITPDSSAYLLLDRAARCLTTADIPYERIASVNDVLAEPLRRHSVLNLAQELRQFKSLLPEDDAAAVTLKNVDSAVVVQGDPERLSFAFRSLLGYLLAVRVPEGRLCISLITADGEAAASITLRGADNASVSAAIARTPEEVKAATRDEIAYAEASAVAVALHGLEAIRAVIEAHGGRLLQRTAADGEVHLVIDNLRLAASGEAEETRAAAGGPQ